jgi:hypothetical protein
MNLIRCLVSVLICLLGCSTSRADELSLVDAGGGGLSAPIAIGDRLYVGTGVTLSIWSLAVPTTPVLVGRTAADPAPGRINALALVDDLLYATWHSPDGQGGIRIYALADPDAPELVAEVDDYVEDGTVRPSALAVSGRYVYVGDSERGLVVLDAIDPLDPQLVAINTDVFGFDAMRVDGARLVTSGKNFFGGNIISVFDITTPAAPAFVGGAATDFTIRSIAITPGHTVGAGFDLRVFDHTAAGGVTEIFSTSLERVATGVLRSGDALYLIGTDGIDVWSFATPSNPVFVRTLDEPVFLPDALATTGLGPVILTRTDRGLVLDTSTPLDPSVSARFPLPFGAAAHNAAFDAGRVVFGAEAYGFSVADEAFTPLARFDADLPFDGAARDIEDIDIDGGRAYLAVWGYGVIIADPHATPPVELGRFEFPFATTIEAHGDRVYVAASTNGGILRILDVSNPGNPLQLGELLTSKTMDLTVRGTLAFLADESTFGEGGLRIVDVADPSAPTVIGHYQGCTDAEGVDVSEDRNTAYVACADGTLHLVDIADRANPAQVGVVTLPGSALLPDYNVAYSVRLNGGIAYVGNENGVDVVDVSARSAPEWLERQSTGYFVRAIERAPGGRLFGFGRDAGVFVYAETRLFNSSFE